MPSDCNNAQQERSFIDTVKAAANSCISGLKFHHNLEIAGNQLPWDPNQEDSIPAAGVIRINWLTS